MEIPGIDSLISGGGGGLVGFLVTFFIMKNRIDDIIEWKKEHTIDADRRTAAYDSKLTQIEIRLGTGEQKFEQMSGDIKEIKNDLKTLLNRRRGDREKDE